MGSLPWCYTFFFDLTIGETIISRVCLIHSSCTTQPYSYCWYIYLYIGIHHGPHKCVYNIVFDDVGHSQMDLSIYNFYIYYLYCYFITISFSFIIEDNRCCRQHHDFISSYIFVDENACQNAGLLSLRKTKVKTGVFVIDKNTQNI